MSGAYDVFLGIDWSGAKGRLKGLQVAECAPGSASPRLVEGPRSGGVWRRGDVIDLISDTIHEGKRVLAGFDFAFAYAYQDRGSYFPGYAGSPPGPKGLWAFVDGFGAGDDDYYGAHVYGPTSPVRAHYIGPGFRGEHYTHRNRLTELACAEQSTSPHPVFKCIGAANVGTGSLAGMRVLHRMRHRLGSRIAVWPFEPIQHGASTICEIYPRLYFKLVGLDPRNWQDGSVVDQTLHAYGSTPYAGPPLKTEDEADAVVSAAALRALSARPEVWRAPEARPESAPEGWIFGVE
jgi:hypothetical protein